MSVQRIAEETAVVVRLWSFYTGLMVDYATSHRERPQRKTVYDAALKCRELADQLEDAHAELLAAARAARR